MQGALKGLKVIEMGHVIAGPFCGGMLGDFGAEVIKVEMPGEGDGLRAMGRVKDMFFAQEGRNKKCVTLNLKSEQGKAMLETMLKEADLLIENYRPGVLAKLGFSWDRLQEINKRLIQVSVSGYGQSGPYRLRPGYDSVGMAMGGLTYVSGFEDGPPTRPGYCLGDYVTGLFAALGAMYAIYARDVQGLGVGQIVDLSLYESIFRLSDTMVGEYGFDGTVKGRIGNAHLATVPSGVFQTKDDKWVVISVGNDRVFTQYAECVGRPDLLEDPRLKTQSQRVGEREYLESIAAEYIRGITLEQALAQFEGKLPAAPVMTVQDICNDPHYAARQDIVEVPDRKFGMLKMPNAYPKLSLTPGEVRWTGPKMGEHNVEVYGELFGYTEQEVADLQAQGII